MKSSNEFASKQKKDHDLETVLVLQGGGSLGAYECGKERNEMIIMDHQSDLDNHSDQCNPNNDECDGY